MNVSMKKTKFCLSLHYYGANSYLYVNKTEIYKFKVHDNILTGVYQSQISLNGTVHDFSLDHSSAEKEEACNLHEYLLVKNNIK